MKINFIFFLLVDLCVLYAQDVNYPDDLNIRYNQVSYTSSQQKLVNLTSKDSFGSIPYTVYDDQGVERLVQNATVPHFWAPAEKFVSTIDLSRLDQEGSYELHVNDKKISFTIQNNGLTSLAKASLKYYYYNRASTSIPNSVDSLYSRKSGIPDDSVHIHTSAVSKGRPEGFIISAPGGWYDAGDYNKYIVNSGISTYSLLAAYTQFPDYYDQLKLDIPESDNSVADILEEAQYNIDWMLSMQDPEDGGVYHKLTGLHFSGVIMPEDYDLPRYVVTKSTAAALNFTAVLAKASTIHTSAADFDPAYSAKMLDAATKAYQWALDHPTTYYKNPPDVSTGEYGDDHLEDEFIWAATELYLATGEQDYLDQVDLSSIENVIPTWSSVGMLGVISLNAQHEILDKSLSKKAETKLLTIADSLKASIENSPMHTAMRDGDFNWGSNGNAGNQLFLLLSAYARTKDTDYLEAAYVGLDYLLGRNATGYSFITGFGKKSPLHPHHRISEADQVTAPVPGMVVGGPNAGQQDDCSYPSDHPAASYSDSFCSYASNEVTINWNAPAVYVLGALDFYSKKTIED